MVPARGPREATGASVSERRPGFTVWVATCGGIGYFPVAPGTLGSALGVGLVVVLGRLPIGRLWLTASVFAAAAAIFVLGVWASGRAEKFFGRVDPPPVIIDEVVGQMITLLARPQGSWKFLLAGFVLFRALDVVKPFPARRAEKAPGGWGIMSDDVIAGGYGVVLLWLSGLVLRWGA
jgi:phosphatidylglycerophosphatase A